MEKEKLTSLEKEKQKKVRYKKAREKRGIWRRRVPVWRNEGW